jgi:dimethylhistidine N-methyltransferase
VATGKRLATPLFPCHHPGAVTAVSEAADLLPSWSAALKTHQLPAAVTDAGPSRQAFLEDIQSGLRRAPRSLPSKYLYDEAGSRLFDEICELPEYYLTRVELAIMRHHAETIGWHVGRGVLLVELGSGSGIKSRLLLDNLAAPIYYVPVDVARQQLERSAAALARDFPHVEVLPVCADFTGPFQLPDPSRAPARRVVYFPGSTIGNFELDEAISLLRRIADLCVAGGGLLIGVDLKKDVRELEAAYNDSRGVTAAFNQNLLRRINRELGGDFRVERFRHRAVYHARRGRMELGLVSQCRQSVTVAGEQFHFAAGEEIRTEYSYKYTVDEFNGLAACAGFELARHWTDPRRRFAVLYFIHSG